MIRSTLAAFADSISIPSRKRSGPLTFTPNRVKVELLAGLTVALALVPEAVAFAFVAGVEPLVGLYAAFIVGLITALIGGRPGMISGATGALAVVMVALVADHGVEYLFATVILMGLLQITAGIFRLGKFIRLVPHPVMLGFVNGLAIVIGMAQLSQFQSAPPVRIPGEHYGPFHILEGTWLTGSPLMMMIGLVLLTMFLIWATPKVTKALPAPLVGIGLVTALVIALKLDVQTVSDLASIKGGLPNFHMPFTTSAETVYGPYKIIGGEGFAPLAPFNLDTLKIIFPYALILAAIGLIESLLTLNLVGEIKEERGGASQECVAQGVANTVTGFFGGMGGCAMIGQSMINVKSGGRTRLSGISAALFLLIFILFGSKFIGMIPLAALVGVMFMVVIGTFAWQSLTIMRRIPLIDALVIVLVTVVTVYHDLAVAVVVGVIVSALGYAWNAARRIDAHTEAVGDTKIYKLEGPLFFGSIEGFNELFDPKNDPNEVIVDFANSRVVDQSALQAIEALADKYTQAGKAIRLRHLTRDCHKLLNRAGQLMIDSDDDPEYEIATDYGVRTGRLGSGH
jgi:SulP family sulfate permease